MGLAIALPTSACSTSSSDRSIDPLDGASTSASSGTGGGAEAAAPEGLFACDLQLSCDPVEGHANQSWGGVECARTLVESGQPGVVLTVSYGPTIFQYNQMHTLYVLLGNGMVLVHGRLGKCLDLVTDCFLPGADPGPTWEPWEPAAGVDRCAIAAQGPSPSLSWAFVSDCVNEPFPACEDVTAPLEDSGG